MRVAVAITLTDDERATLQRSAPGAAWKRGGCCEPRLCWPPPQASRIRRSPTNWVRCARRSRCGVTASLSSGWPESRRIPLRGGRPRRPNKNSRRGCENDHYPAAARRHALEHADAGRALGHVAVDGAALWTETNLQPHRVKTFKLSKDAQFAEKLVDVVGLYLNTRARDQAVLRREDQIQALDRTQKGLPIHPGRLGTMTHDYKRHGTTTLFAALNVAEGIVIDACMSRHRHQEWY